MSLNAPPWVLWFRTLLASTFFFCGVGCTGDDTNRIGETCARDGECSSGRCDELVCKASKPKAADEGCSHPLECRSEHCMFNPQGKGVCGPGQREPGTRCTDALQCRVGSCTVGYCGGPPRDAGQEGPIVEEDAAAPKDAVAAPKDAVAAPKDAVATPKDAVATPQDTATPQDAVADRARDTSLADQEPERGFDLGLDQSTDRVADGDHDSASDLPTMRDGLLLADSSPDLSTADRSIRPGRLAAPLHFDNKFMRRIQDLGWDSAGNLVLGMEISEPVDFGPGYQHPVRGMFDILVASFDAQGKHRWSRRFGEDSIESLNALVVADNAIYFTGSFGAGLDFGNTVLAAKNSSDVYLARLRADTGATGWAKQYGGAPGADSGVDLDLDGSGNLVLAGNFGYSINFGGADLIGVAKSADTFIARFSPQGAHLSSRRYGSATNYSNEFPQALTLDAAGNTYLTGSYGPEAANFGGPDLGSDGFYAEAFVVGHTPAGAHRWSQSVFSGRTAAFYGSGIAVGPDGQRVAVIGDFGSTMVHGFAGQSGTSAWSKSPGGNTRAMAVAADPAGNFYLCGYTSGSSVDLGDGAFTPTGIEGFVVSYTAGGTFRWLKRFTGGGQVFVQAIHHGDGITIAGTYVGSVNLDGVVLSSTDGGFVYSLP